MSPSSEQASPIRVLIAEDEPVIRHLFRSLLEDEGDIEVVGEATNGWEIIALARSHHPDVVLMDIRMPRMDGIEATKRLVATHDCKVLILTNHDLDDYAYAALQAGASGFLLKDRPPHKLADAIRTVQSGDALLAPSVTRRLVARYGKGTPIESPKIARLTRRELEVLELLARGLSNEEIADKLFITEVTVRTHVNRVVTKLDLRDRVQAVVFAYEHGLVSPLD